MVYNDETITAAVAQGLATARDPSQPDDADRAPDKYARLSDDLPAHGSRGLPQASKKAWGMVAETIKAICAQHGLLRALAHGCGIGGLRNRGVDAELFPHGPRSTHKLEDEETAEDVAAGLRLCEELSDRLYEPGRNDRLPDTNLETLWVRSCNRATGCLRFH